MFQGPGKVQPVTRALLKVHPPAHGGNASATSLTDSPGKDFINAAARSRKFLGSSLLSLSPRPPHCLCTPLLRSGFAPSGPALGVRASRPHLHHSRAPAGRAWEETRKRGILAGLRVQRPGSGTSPGFRGTVLPRRPTATPRHHREAGVPRAAAGGQVLRRPRASGSGRQGAARPGGPTWRGRPQRGRSRRRGQGARGRVRRLASGGSGRGIQIIQVIRNQMNKLHIHLFKI